MSGLLLRPAAAADVEGAYAWYEGQRRGLGEEFLEVLSSTLESLRILVSTRLFTEGLVVRFCGGFLTACSIA